MFPPVAVEQGSKSIRIIKNRAGRAVKPDNEMEELLRIMLATRIRFAVASELSATQR